MQNQVKPEEALARSFAEILRELTEGDKREALGYMKCLREIQSVQQSAPPPA